MELIVKTIYNLAIRCYVLLIRIAAIFNTKAKKWVVGRRNLMDRLARHIPPKGVDVWIHCASLGEFEQGRPLIEALRKQHPDLYILLTFFSPSGYEIRKTYPAADLVSYLPADTPKKAKRWVSLLKPEITVFVKYEFWYHFIRELQKQQRAVILISGIFRKEQLFFKRYGLLFRKLLKEYDCLFLQDKKSAEILRRAGIPNFRVVGDTRVDRVQQLAQKGPEFPEIVRFIDGKACWIGGSTWPADEQLLKTGIKRIPKWIIAPHEIDNNHLQEIEKLFSSHGTIRYSTLQKNPEAGKAAAVLIIDNIGMLSSVYKLARVAYIGGGFGKGIHNILEAAVHHIPVIFGPNYQKFEEARALIARGGAFTVQDEAELEHLLHQLADAAFLVAAGEKAGEYIEDNLGATKKIMEYIQEKRFLINA